MIVSAERFFSMTPAERELVTEIDLTLDDTCRLVDALQGGRSLAVPHPENDIEPGTDWTKP